MTAKEPTSETTKHTDEPSILEQIPPGPESTPKSPQNGKRNRLLWTTTLIIITLAICWLIFYLAYLQFHESTDDAYANGNLIRINSAISGSVIAFYADDTDLVQEGQLLVELDKTEYQIKYDSALASLAATVLQVRGLFDNVVSNQANLESKSIALSRANYDFTNRSRLVETEAISKEDFVHAREDHSAAKAAYDQAKAQLDAAISAAGNTTIEKHPLIEEARSNVRDAYYNLRHCSIYAPYTGYVAQRTVNVGQSVAPLTPLMSVIPKNYVWVDANFKETQLTYMRIGQPASVWFDIYGSKVRYEGKVLGIASGSGSVFSLIPPQNATGNWIKIVQRLPVRISLDQEVLDKYPARLGISAEVNVDITDQNLPMLAEKPLAHPIATTHVFHLPLDEVDHIIENIIQENLKKTKILNSAVQDTKTMQDKDYVDLVPSTAESRIMKPS